MVLLSLLFAVSVPAATEKPVNPALAVYTANLAEAMNGRSTGIKELEQQRKKGTFKGTRGLIAVGEKICSVDDFTRHCWAPAMRNGATGLKFDGLDEVFVPSSQKGETFRRELHGFLSRNREAKPQAASFWQRLFIETAQADLAPTYKGAPFDHSNRDEQLGEVYASYMGWFTMPRSVIGNQPNDKYYHQLADVITGRSFGQTPSEREAYLRDDDSDILPSDVRSPKNVMCKGDLATVTTSSRNGRPLVMKALSKNEFRVSGSGIELAMKVAQPTVSAEECRKVLANGNSLQSNRRTGEPMDRTYDPNNPAEAESGVRMDLRNESNRNRIVTVNPDGLGRSGLGAWPLGSQYFQFRVCKSQLPTEIMTFASCKDGKCGTEFSALTPEQSSQWPMLSGISEAEIASFRKTFDHYSSANKALEDLEQNPPSGKDGATLAAMVEAKTAERDLAKSSLDQNPLQKFCRTDSSFEDCSKRQEAGLRSQLNRLSLRAAAAGICCADPKCRLHMYEKENGINVQDEPPASETQKAQ